MALIALPAISQRGWIPAEEFGNSGLLLAAGAARLILAGIFRRIVEVQLRMSTLIPLQELEPVGRQQAPMTERVIEGGWRRRYR